MEVVSELVEACSAVQAVGVEVEILLVSSAENEHVLANQQGQAEETLPSAEEKMHQRLLFDLEKLV